VAVAHRLDELIAHECIEVALTLFAIQPFAIRRHVIVAHLRHEAKVSRTSQLNYAA
jgi:hypothetical protein